MMVGLAVTPADVQDRDMAAPLLKVAKAAMPTLDHALADGGYQGEVTADAVKKTAGLSLKIVKRSDDQKGFKVLRKRWIVERTFGWLRRCRRLAKDFENLNRSQVGFVMLTMIRLMMRRIARLRAQRLREA